VFGECRDRLREQVAEVEIGEQLVAEARFGFRDLVLQRCVPIAVPRSTCRATSNGTRSRSATCSRVKP